MARQQPMRPQSSLRSPVNFLLVHSAQLSSPVRVSSLFKRAETMELSPCLPFLQSLTHHPPLSTTSAYYLALHSNSHLDGRHSISLMASTEMETTNNGAAAGSSCGGLVVTELSHIKELVRQLELHLGGSPDLCKHLAAQIFSLTERSISLLVTSDLDLDLDRRRKRPAGGDAGLASPLSAAATPTSDVTADGPFRSATTKKRRKVTTEQRRQRVRSAGGENPVDDGHSWRKYGQKEILGAKHPRGYYRCTHRHSQGCQATKQVQRTDEDPALFDVIYHGDHTCVAPAAAAAHNPDADAHLQSLTAGLTVKTEGLPDPTPPPPQQQGGCWSAATPVHLSASTPTSGNWPGVSPATSDSNHVASYLPPFDDAEWRGHAELEVVSALVAASAPPPPPPTAVDSFDDLLLIDIDDIASYFA